MFGRAGSGGYALTIRQIAVRPGAITVRVQIDTPDPGRAQTAAMTTPMHVVAVPWEDLKKAWDGVSQVAWTVTDTQGNRLLEASERRW